MSFKRQREEIEEEEEEEDDLYCSSDETRLSPLISRSKKRKSSEMSTLNRTSLNNAEGDEARVRELSRTEREVDDKEEAGYIKHIKLQDFMCHQHLEMNLSSKINFIIGQNGSGKSAILSAVVIGFGAKAVVTNRASNLKSLIREGANFAQIELKISNRGFDAYKHDKYGDSITIERRITRDGNNSLKIKCLDKSVETKKDELIAIIDHFGIQVDNPLTILNQDAAREFLSSSNDEIKYKGTWLSQLWEGYSIISESINITKAAIALSEQALPELKQAAKEARFRYNDMKKALSLEGMMQDLKNQMAWSQVADKENEVEKQMESLRKSQTKMSEIEKRIATENEQQARIMAKIEGLEAELNKAVASTEPLNERKIAISNEIKTIKERQADFINEEIQQNNTVKELRRRKTTYEHQIDDETKKLTSEDRNQRTQILTQIQDLEREVQIIKGGFKLLDEEKIENRSALDRLQTLRSKCQNEHELEREIDEAVRLLTDLKSQKENRVKAFGNTMPEILQAINAENQWKRKPVGPFGMHIKLKHLEWADLLESIIGHMLRSFLVETFEDEKILRAILTRYRCPVAIYVLKYDIFEFHDVPDEKFQTILRVLEFDNEWVKRLFIINNDIHKKILVQKRLEAEKFMYPKYPRNVTACYTIDLFQIGHVSGMATRALNRYKGPPRFTADVGPRIQKCEEKLRKLKDKLHETKEITIEERELSRQGEELNNRRSRMKRDISFKQDEITCLKDKLQDEEPANIAAWQEAIQDIENQIKQIIHQFANLAHDKAQLATELTQSLETLHQVDEQLQTAKSELERINELIITQQIDRAQIESNLKNWAYKKTRQQQQIEDHSETLKDTQDTLAEWTEQAVEYCPERVEVTKSSQELDKEINRIQTMLRAKEKEMGINLDKIAREATEKVEALNHAKKDIRDLNQFVDLLIKSLNERRRRYDIFRSAIIMRAKLSFLFFLEQRGFTGKLHFDNSKGKLQVKAKSEEEVGVKSSHDKDPRSLSGGEKSFSTICLLLSLWECVSASFICLDEFDVFMDAENRKTSMKMLIDNASSSESQCIFITPQDASNIKPGANIHVHKLRNPERGQGRLNFAA